jgi:hypothetical protein
MLDAGRAPQQIGGLTVFFDHADERRRYVLADTPRLVAAPDPQLSLVVFRGTGTGGLLQLESTLAPTEAQLTAVRQELAQRGPAPILARPDWRRGAVRIAGWLQAQELAPLQLVLGMPSLVGDPVATIAARLDAAGAALADAALRGNALPTVVMFELETLGLAGPLGVQAEANLQAIHDRLTAEGALTTPYGRARIKKTWESAARDNLITVQVVDESGDVEGQRAEAMRRIGEDLMARMFSPYPPPERPPQLGDGAVAPIELSFRLTARREELSTSSRWDFRERRAVPIRHYAASSLVDLLGHRDPAAFITFADLDAAGVRDVVVRVEPELTKLGLSAVEVDLRESTAGAVARTFVLTDEEPEQRTRFLQSRAAIQYRVRTHFDPQLTAAEDRQSDWQEAIGGLVVVSARHLFPPRQFTMIAGRVEFDWMDRVDLLVRPPGEPPRSVSLTKDTQSADLFLPAAGGRALSVEATWRGAFDEPTRSDPPRTADDDVLVLDSPFADSLNVVVVPLPLPDVQVMAVDLRTRFQDFEHVKTVSWTGADRSAQRVGLRRLPGSPRSYEFRYQIARAGGTLVQQPWTTTDATTLAIPSVAQGVTVRTVDVFLLGGGPAKRGSVAVELALEAGTDRTSTILEGETDTATLTLVVPKSAPAPTLIAREFLDTGDVKETRWTDLPAMVVIPQIPMVV